MAHFYDLVGEQLDYEMSWVDAWYCGSRNGAAELDDFVGAGPVIHAEADTTGLGGMGAHEPRHLAHDVDPVEFTVTPPVDRPRRPPPLPRPARPRPPPSRARTRIREEAAAFYGSLPQAIRADPDFDPAVEAWKDGRHVDYARHRGAVKARTGATPTELSEELARARYG